MPPKKKQDPFPPECCGVCSYWHLTHEQEQLGSCFALPPVLVFDGEDVIGVRPVCEPNEPACMYFKGRLHG